MTSALWGKKENKVKMISCFADRDELVTVLYRVIKVGFTEEVIHEQNPEEGEGDSEADIWEESVSGTGKR